jgi:hypothetical protein
VLTPQVAAVGENEPADEGHVFPEKVVADKIIQAIPRGFESGPGAGMKVERTPLFAPHGIPRSRIEADTGPSKVMIFPAGDECQELERPEDIELLLTDRRSDSLKCPWPDSNRRHMDSEWVLGYGILRGENGFLNFKDRPAASCVRLETGYPLECWEGS